MKITKTICNACAGLAVFICITACGGSDDSKSESIEFAVMPTTITLNDNGSSTINVSSSAEWYVSTVTESWLTATPQNGKGRGTVTLTASENNTKSTRTAQVVITEVSTSKSAVVNVSQQPATPRIESDKSTLSFTSEGGEETIVVTSNQAWTVESSEAWCTVSPRMGSGNASVAVGVKQNATLTSRTATITIKSVDNSLQPVKVQVTQEGVAFSVSPLNVTIGENLTSSITIKTSSQWSVTNITGSWLTVTPVSGKGDATLTLKAVGPNNTRETKTVEVEITENSAALVQTVKVSQLPAPPTLQADNNSLSFTCNAGEKTVQITSNRNWTATSNASWCTVSPRTGSNNGSLKVTVIANEALTSRSAVITITPDDSNLSPLTIQVSQQEYVETKPGENDNNTPQYSRKK